MYKHLVLNKKKFFYKTNIMYYSDNGIIVYSIIIINIINMNLYKYFEEIT